MSYLRGHVRKIKPYVRQLCAIKLHKAHSKTVVKLIRNDKIEIDVRNIIAETMHVVDIF